MDQILLENDHTWPLLFKVGLKLPFSGQVLKPFWPSMCIFSLNFPCKGTKGAPPPCLSSCRGNRGDYR